MPEILPLVDCCDVPIEAKIPGSGVSPFAIEPNPLKRPLSRRRIFRGLAATAAGAAVACGGVSEPKQTAQSTTAAPAATTSAAAGGSPTAAPTVLRVEDIDIAFCSQVMCSIPLEVASRRNFFRDEGLRVKIVYMRGGALAMQSLLSSSVDYVLTPMDVVVSAHAAGRNPVMIASASSLPFFALVTAPGAKIESVRDLRGKKVGINNLNTTDHLLARLAMEKNGIDDASAQFVPVGANLFDALVRGQVDAGMVQEPALTLSLSRGSKLLVNFMTKKDSQEYLGGPYQFLGLNTRPEIVQQKPDLLKRIIRALDKANNWVRTTSGAEIAKNIAEELVAGGDLDVFAKSLDQFKLDLYPDTPRLDPAAIQRVIDAQKLSGAIDKDVKVEAVYTNALLS